MEIIKHYILRGPNYYSRRPLIKLIFDPINYQKLTKPDFLDLKAQLNQDLPSLMEHHCNSRQRGGFISEVENGTSLAHIVEHLAIEFQYLLGHNVGFGRTISLSESNLYLIIYEYQIEQVGVEAGYQAVTYLKSLLKRKPTELREIIDSLKKLDSRYAAGPSTKALIQEAKRRDIPVLRLNDESLYQMGYGKPAKRIKASITSQTSCIAADIASDKKLVYDMLASAGIPVPYGVRISSVNEALKSFAKLQKPVVVKPNSLNHGKGITLDINNDNDLAAACKRALELERTVLLQEQVSGDDYRLLVVDGKMVAAARRMPPEAIGNGRASLKELIAEINRSELRGEGHEKPLTKVKLDQALDQVLSDQGFSLTSVPAAGQRVRLRHNANLSSGGTAEDVTELVHPEIRALAELAAKLVGLDIAGVDMIAQDIRKDPEAGGVYIIEINACPGLRMHLYPSKGQPRNVAQPILDYLFPRGSQARIPIISITGTNGKTTTARLIAQILKTDGKVVGLTSTDGIEVDGQHLTYSDDAGPGGARVVLSHPEVEVAVLETARGGILRSGLGYDRCDIGIVTNVSDDHINQDGIYSTRDIADVKSVVYESVKHNGWAIINADDPFAEYFTDQCASNIAYFSLDKDNRLLTEQTNGVAAFIEDGEIVIIDHEKQKAWPVVSVRDIPITLGGVVDFNIINCLAAALGAYLSGVKPETIRSGLMSFEVNLGRMNCFKVNNLNFVIDYAHNSHSLTMLIGNVRRLCGGKRIIGVFTAPGDRCNESLENLGRIMSRVDYLILREDKDLRGRQPGEVSALLKSGAGGEDKANPFPDEESAIEHALTVAQPDDWIVINYEKLKYSYTALNQAFQKLGWPQYRPETAGNRPVLRLFPVEGTSKKALLYKPNQPKQMVIPQVIPAELEGSDCWQYTAGKS